MVISASELLREVSKDRAGSGPGPDTCRVPRVRPPRGRAPSPRDVGNFPSVLYRCRLRARPGSGLYGQHAGAMTTYLDLLPCILCVPRLLIAPVCE